MNCKLCRKSKNKWFNPRWGWHSIRCIYPRFHRGLSNDCTPLGYLV